MDDHKQSQEYSERAVAGLRALLERKRKARPELYTKEVYQKLSDVVRQARKGYPSMGKRSTEDQGNFERQAVLAMDRLMDVRNEEARKVLANCSASFQKLMDKKMEVNGLLVRSHNKRKQFIFKGQKVVNQRKGENVSSPSAFIKKRTYPKGSLFYMQPIMKPT